MGGGSFAKPASGLTAAQREALEQHCKKSLEPLLFEYLVVACPQMDLGIRWLGSDGGPIPKNAVASNTASPEFTPKQVNGRMVEVKMAKGHPQYEAWNAWLESMATAMKGVDWHRAGGTRVKLAVAIPYDIIDSSGTTAASETDQAFYQVDVCLLPPSEVDFSLFIKSFGVVRIILASTVRLITRQVVLHMTHLELVHSPWPGLPPIIIYLSASVEEICSWLGLDSNRWNRGFKDEPELFTWLIDIRHDGILAEGYERIRQSTECLKHSGAKNSRKIPGWKRFVDLIRSDRCHLDNGEVFNLTSMSATLPTESEVDINPINLITPKKPVQLDDHAKAALDRWDKWEEYNELYEERKEEAIARAALQQRKFKKVV